MKAVIIIPARLESTRLPRKLLLAKTGKPLIQHTWEQAIKTGFEVYVVTDSLMILQQCDAFGAKAFRSGECNCGTDRVRQVADYLDDGPDVIINWQADEPEIDPEIVRQMAEETYIWDKIVTLAFPIDFAAAHDSNMVKAVITHSGQALYFSRAPVPWNGPWWGHCGIYSFPPDFFRDPALKELSRRSQLEESERLEQLRWLDEGMSIHVVQTQEHCWGGIDTQQDYDNFVTRQAIRSQKGDQ